MPPDTPGSSSSTSTTVRLMVATFAEHASTVMQMIQNDRKLRGFGHGSEKVNKNLRPYDGYPGMVFITAGSERQPQMIQDNGQPVDPANTMACMAIARKMYGGLPGQRCDQAVGAEEQARQRHPLRPRGGPVPAGRCTLWRRRWDVTGLFGAVAAPTGPSASGAAMPGFMGGGGFAPVPPMPAAPFGAPTLPSFLGVDPPCGATSAPPSPRFLKPARAHRGCVGLGSASMVTSS